MLNSLFVVVVLSTLAVGKEMEILESRPNSCPRGFTKFRNFCFFAGTNKVSWYEAMQICKYVARGNELAEIYDQPLQQFLQKFIQDKGDYGEFWVGGTNIMDNSTFVWNHSRQHVNERLWDANEPNNINNAEHCTELRRDGFLNDNDCHAYRMYICAHKLS